MNANFVFPRPQPGVPRPRPARAAKWSSSSSSSPPSNLAGSRDSNALRASILDTALELGIGSNPLVTDWMFNNPLMEEPEDVREPVPSPCLTLASPTSQQSMHSHSSSWLHSQYPRDLIANLNGHGVNFNLNQDVNKLKPLNFQGGDAVAGGLNDMDSQNSNPNERASNVRNSNTISVNDSSIASHIIRPKSATPSVRKLRKKHPGGDGYESMSEKKAKKKEKSGDAMDAKHLLEDKKKKGFINKVSNDVQFPSQGYETDGSAVPSLQKSKKDKKKSKLKNPSKGIGYDTDGGYQSDNRKSKSRFFKLSTKSSRPDFHAATSGSVPALPNIVEKKRESVVPLPIAGRFARNLSFSMPSRTTTESAETHVDNSFPQFSFQPFQATFTSTSSSSPVSAGPSSTFDRAQIAPTSDSPSAFNAHLHIRNRDSRFSFASSSSGSGSNQHNKLQYLKGLISPLHSPPSSMQGHQQHGLRPSLSLSSLQHSKPVISLPITRGTSQTSTNPPLSTRSLHSHSVSPTSASFRSSVSSLQSKKPFRIKLHPDLPTQQHSPAQTVSSPSVPGSPHVFLTPSLPVLQIPRFAAKVRPKNPPTSGFGPRSPLTSDSAAPGSTLGPSPITSPILSSGPSPTDNGGLSPNQLSPNQHIQAGSKRSSQQTIIPSSDYIVPSPRDSPLKTQNPGLPSPTVLTAYHHHIPPQPSPAPKGPLPTPPSSSENESLAAAGNNIGSSGSAGQQLPLAVHLRQRMSKMNMRQQSLPSQSTVATRPISVDDGSGVETVVGLRIEKKKRGIVVPSVDDIPKDRKEKAKEARLSRFTADNRPSWIDIGEDTTRLDKKKQKLEVEEDQEVEEPAEDLYEILERFENRDNEIEDIHHSSSSEQALERSHSFKAGKLSKEKRRYPTDNSSFNARPPRPYVPVAAVAPDVYGFEDDGKSVGDRTSRWTESVYSRSSSSILDEEESEVRRDRFVRRVEAMLDAERAQAHDQAYIPPLPEIPRAYANIIHKQPNRNGNTINENAGHHHPNNTPGRGWNKF